MAETATVLGIDPGSKRIGVAIADLETRFARPLTVLDAGKRALAAIVELAAENHAIKIVVGKPVGLSGRAGPAVAEQQVFVGRLRESTDIEVVEYDERLTTVVAESGLRAGGANRAARKQIRDAVAAQVLLQGYLDSTR